MADAIVRHGYALPRRILWYAPGGVPFAYPPLTLYVMAAITHGLGVAHYRYLEVAPPLFTALTLVPLYALFSAILGSRLAALLGAVFTVTNPTFFIPYALSDGSVRGLAVLLMVTTLAIGWRALEHGEPRWVSLAAISLGATIGAHLENALFAALSLTIFALARASSWRRVALVAVIGGGALLVAAPWWLVVVHRFGMGVFLSALGAQASLGGQKPGLGSAIVLLVVVIVRLLQGVSASDGLYLLAFLGLWLSRRQGPLIPVWLAVSMVVLPHGLRQWAIPLGAGFGLAVVTVAGWVARRLSAPAGLAVPAVLALFSIAVAATAVRAVNPALTSGDLGTVRWLRGNSPPDTRVFVASSSESRAEWYPYLTHRATSIPLWGSEFTGDHPQQLASFYAQAGCTTAGSIGCLERVIRRRRIPVTVLVVHDAEFPGGSRVLRRTGWRLAYTNGGVATWERGR